MPEIHNRVYLNAREIPVRGENETAVDFESRMEHFRKNDLRVPVAGRGKPNFGFDHNYIPKLGAVNNGDDAPRKRMEFGEETGEITYNPHAGGSFSVVIK